MSSFPFYAVVKGFVPGIYTSNVAAVQQVLYFSGSCMKGFKTLAAAEQFMALTGVAQLPLLGWLAPAVPICLPFAAAATIVAGLFTFYSNPETRG